MLQHSRGRYTSVRVHSHLIQQPCEAPGREYPSHSTKSSVWLFIEVRIWSCLTLVDLGGQILRAVGGPQRDLKEAPGKAVVALDTTLMHLTLRDSH